MPFKGYKQTEEHRAKLSAALKGKKQTPELITKRAVANTGKKRSPETCVKISEARKGKYCGSENWMWKGGISYEPYCILFNKEFKERVRENYDRKCVECGKSEKENGRKHCVHHVNYHKDACCNENVKPLFVTLCQSCHAKTTNSDREYYEVKYTNLINEKYGGKCYLPKSTA